MPLLSNLLALATVTQAAVFSRDTTISRSYTDSTNNQYLGFQGQTTNIDSGVLVWLNGGGTHNQYGNINNAGMIVMSQTYYLQNFGNIGGMTSNFVKATSTDGYMNNTGTIQLNDIGSGSAPTYDWYTRTMTNAGTVQWCGRGDTGGSTYQMYSDNDSRNTGLISFEQSFSNYGASFVWRNSALSTTGGNNLYNDGSFRLINTVFHNVQNVYGTGCWIIGQGAVLYLEDGTGVYQNPTAGPSFPNQSISFQHSTADLHMDTASYSRNSNFGPQIYGFGTGNAIEFYETISTFSYSSSTGILNVRMTSGNSVNLKLGPGYSSSLFSNARNPSKYNTGGYNAIFYSGAAPSQSAPGTCAVSVAPCQDLRSFPPTAGSGSSSSSSVASSTQSSIVASSSATRASTTAASSLQSSAAPSSTVQSSSVQSSAAQSSTAQSSTAQSSTAQSSTAQSSTAQSSAAQSSSASRASSASSSSVAQTSSAQSSAAQSSTVQSSAAQSSTVQSSAAQSSTRASTIVVVPTTSSTRSAAPSSTAPVVPSLNYLGCYTDSVSSRGINDFPRSVNPTGMTVEVCQAYCSQYNSLIFGIEYGTECYCGNQLYCPSVKAAEADCSFPCPGNSSEFCGAGNRLSVYGNFPAGNPPTCSSSSSSSVIVVPTTSSSVQVVPTTSSSVVVPTTSSSVRVPTTSSSVQVPSTSSAATLTSTRAATTASSSTSSAASPAYTCAYQGCYTDSTSNRALNDFPRSVNATGMSVEVCQSYCSQYTASFFGVEYGTECYCGNSLLGGSTKAAESDCNFVCPGNALENCGAGDRLNVYGCNGAPTLSGAVSSTSSSAVVPTSTAAPVLTTAPVASTCACTSASTVTVTVTRTA